MGSGYPVVYHSVTLADLLLYILKHHAAPTIIVVCTSRDDFLTELIASVESKSHSQSGSYSNHDKDEANPTEQQHSAAQNPALPVRETSPIHHLLVPTLRLLAQAHTISLAFVTSVPALHAYLSTISARSHASDLDVATDSSDIRTVQHAPTPILALLGVVALHRGTAAFSAQGLGRAFAAAVEAGWDARMRVVLWEGWTLRDHGDEQERLARHDGGMLGENPSTLHDGHGNGELDGNAEAIHPVDINREMPDLDSEMQDPGDTSPLDRPGTSGHGNGRDHHADLAVWDEEVPVLNAATKTFGPAGERRGWLGRTVKVRDVVGRWFVFEDPFGQNVA